MPTPSRTPLSRDRVLAAAVELADADGLPAVSMRSLAGRLGVVPMALYKHVGDKEDLVDGMVDAVVAAYDVPAPGLPWQEATRSRILAARRSLLAHPWLRAAIESRARRTPAVLGHMDAVAGELIAGGLSVDLTHHAMHALGHRIWGFSPEAFDEPGAGPPSDPAEREAMLAAVGARYPHIAAIAAASLADEAGGCDEGVEFAFGLDLLLDAVAALHARGWRSRG